jgi:hypothetical protein
MRSDRLKKNAASEGGDLLKRRWICHYNAGRPHASLEGKYPLQEYRRLAA